MPVDARKADLVKTAPRPARSGPQGAARGTVRVAAVQSSSEMGEVAWNVDRLDKHCRACAAKGVRIIVLPETSVTGYLSSDLQTNWHLEGRPIHKGYQPRNLATADVAEVVNGSSVLHFAALATELGVYITVPFIEVDQGQYFNAVSLVGPHASYEKATAAGAGSGAQVRDGGGGGGGEGGEGGEEGDATGGGVRSDGGGRDGCGKAFWPTLAHYRKNCPWHLPEQSWATPGAGVHTAVYDTEYGRVGMAVCFDIHSILSKYADQGLWALLYPIAWVGSTEFWFGAELPRRLKEINCPFAILGANWATRAPPKWTGAGGSAIYGPRGKVLAVARGGFKDDIIMCDLPVSSASSASSSAASQLDLGRYARWTTEQPGTDYWTTGKGSAFSPRDLDVLQDQTVSSGS